MLEAEYTITDKNVFFAFKESQLVICSLIRSASVTTFIAGSLQLPSVTEKRKINPLGKHDAQPHMLRQARPE